MLVAGATVAACAPSPAPPRCEASVDGVWRTGQVVDGEALGYHFLERGAAIEGYPTLRDVPADLPPGVRAAPAAIDLVRADGALLGGRWARRYELGGLQCTVAAPVRVARCAGRELVLELGPLAPPTDWAACAPPRDARTLASTPPPPGALTLALRR